MLAPILLWAVQTWWSSFPGGLPAAIFFLGDSFFFFPRVFVNISFVPFRVFLNSSLDLLYLERIFETFLPSPFPLDDLSSPPPASDAKSFSGFLKPVAVSFLLSVHCVF